MVGPFCKIAIGNLKSARHISINQSFILGCSSGKLQPLKSMYCILIKLLGSLFLATGIHYKDICMCMYVYPTHGQVLRNPKTKLQSGGQLYTTAVLDEKTTTVYSYSCIVDRSLVLYWVDADVDTDADSP